MIELAPASAARCVPLIFENARNDPDVPPELTLQDLQRRMSSEGWSFIGIFDGDELVGAISVHRNRVHLDIASSRHGKWNPKYILRRGLDMCFKKRKQLVTCVHEDNHRAKKIAEWVGFKEFDKRGGYYCYRMSKSERKI